MSSCARGKSFPPEEFLAQARRYLGAVEAEPRRPRDNSRIVVIGAFCEQPPLGLIKSIERAGCYIVDDDFLLGNRFLAAARSRSSGDPVRALAEAFVHNDLRTSVLYEPDPRGKKQAHAGAGRGRQGRRDHLRDAQLLRPGPARPADAAYRAPSRPASRASPSSTRRTTGQFQQFREQAGTFADSIKLWGGA